MKISYSSSDSNGLYWTPKFSVTFYSMDSYGLNLLAASIILLCFVTTYVQLPMLSRSGLKDCGGGRGGGF